MLAKAAVGSLSSVVALAHASQAQKCPSSFVQKENLKLERERRPLPLPCSLSRHTSSGGAAWWYSICTSLSPLPPISANLVTGRSPETSIRSSQVLELAAMGLTYQHSIRPPVTG